jgi:hypothetical protein
MNEEWVKIEKKENKLFVTVSLPLYSRHNEIKKQKFKTSDVLSYISKAGHKVEKCINDELQVRNFQTSQREKTWIFELSAPKPKPKPAPKPKPKPQATRKRRSSKKTVLNKENEKKVKKTLDKSLESVIIVEEKEDLFTPKKTQSVTEE